MKLKIKKGGFLLLLTALCLLPIGLTTAQRVDQLTIAGTIDGTELLYLQQLSHDRKLRIDSLLSYIGDVLHFSSAFQLQTAGYEDESITLPKLSAAVIGYIGSGGTINNAPDDITLEEVFGTDTTIGIKRSWLNSYVLDSLLFNTTYSTVEKYLATGNTVTQAVQKAIDSAGTRTVLFQDIYALTDKIKVDKKNSVYKNINMLFTKTAKLTSTDTLSTGNIYHPDAIFRITNADNVTIQGMNLEANNLNKTKIPGLLYNEQSSNYNDTWENFLCGLKIDSCKNVKLSDVKLKYAIYNGGLFSDIDNLDMQNCYADSNVYAGFFIQRVKHITINGGGASDNGGGIENAYLGAPYDFGYGLEFGNAFNSALGLNEYATVTGFKAVHNGRNGIGAHQLNGGKFIGNHVYGFGANGFSFTNQGFEFQMKDLIISENTIEQDSAWVVANSLTTNPAIGIQAGSYGTANRVAGYNFGTLIIQGNILKNLNTYRVGYVAGIDTNYLDQAIHVWSSYAKNAQIKDNSIYSIKDSTTYSTTCKYGILIGSGNLLGGQIESVDLSGNHLFNIVASEPSAGGIVSIWGGKHLSLHDNHYIDCSASDTNNAAIRILNDGTSDVATVNIHDEEIVGTYDYGINIYQLDTTDALTQNDIVNIHDVIFDGTIDKWINVVPIIANTQHNNTVKNFKVIAGATTPQSTSLPNLDSKGAGNMTYTIETNDSINVVINTLSLNTLRYDDISATFDIKIIATEAFAKTNIVYNYMAVAGNQDSTIYTDVDLIDYTVYKVRTGLTVDDYTPAVSWANGSDGERTLQMVLPKNWTGYKIYIDFNSWLGVIYQKPN